MNNIKLEVQNGDSYENISNMTLRYISSINFIIPTKNILELEKIIYTWVRIGATGACIWGRPRLGKTYAVQYITDGIHKKFGDNFPVLIWNITDHADTERNFYASILLALGYSINLAYKMNTALVLKEKLLNILETMACDTPHRKIIFMIDEAWKLCDKDFSWLMDLYNNLNNKDVQLVCFLFGTRELKDLKNEFKLSGKDQIVGRFMIYEKQFMGINNKSELAFCLAAFDSLHMVNSNRLELQETIKEYYFPNAHKNQRFFNLADDYWNAFQSVKAKYNIMAEDIPMKYLIDSFNICLDLFGIDSITPVVFPTLEELIESIEFSGYGESDDEYEHKKKNRR